MASNIPFQRGSCIFLGMSSRLGNGSTPYFLFYLRLSLALAVFFIVFFLLLQSLNLAARDPILRDQLATQYSGDGARFIFYTSAYGQFNNQLVSLVNALFISRHAKAILVLPYASLGKESIRNVERAGIRTELGVERQLVGDYFNYTRLLSFERIIRPDQFFASPDARDLFSLGSITVSYRSGNSYRKLFSQPSADFAAQSGQKFKVFSPPHRTAAIRNYCDFGLDTALAAEGQRGRHGRFVFLPIVFRKHSLNCTFEEPDWVPVRRGLVPRNEYMHAADTFLATLKRPIMAVHLRFFLNGDIGNFTVQSFVDMLFREFGHEFNQAASLFLAYSPSSHVSSEAYHIIKTRYDGAVIDGSTIPQFFQHTNSDYASFALSNVLLDMWICVKSDRFLGRLGSSLSWNTVYWRQALQAEYKLLPEQVSPPLWYTLRNFTTTSASRHEGPTLGSNLAH